MTLELSDTDYSSAKLARRVYYILLLAAVVFAALSHLITGYFPEQNNGALHIPFLAAKLDPELFTNDYMLRLPKYGSLAWIFITGLAKLTSLSQALMAGYFLQAYLYFLSISVLSYVLSRRLLWALVVTSYFLLMPQPPIGGSFFFEGQRITHTGLAVPFIVFAITAALQRKVVAALVLWLICALIHLPYAVYALPMLGGILLSVSWKRLNQKLPMPAILAGLAVVGIAVLAGGIVWINRLFSNSIPWRDFELLTGLGVGGTLSHISLEFNFIGPGNLRSVLIQVCAYSAASGLALWRVPAVRPYVFGFYTLFLPLGFGYLVTDVMHNVPLARLMWIRSAYAVFLFGTVFALSIVANPKIIGVNKLSLGFIAFVLAMCMALLDYRWYWAAAPTCLLIPFGFCSDRYYSPVVGRYLPISILFGLLVFFVCFVKVLPHTYSRQTDALLVQQQNRKFVKVQDWARLNAPKDTVFLTPPQYNGWRVHSLRSTFLEFKDRGAVVLSDGIANEFLRRTDMLGYPRGEYMDMSALATIYNNLSDERLREIAATEDVKFALFLNDHLTSLPRAYSNDKFMVLSLE